MHPNYDEKPFDHALPRKLHDLYNQLTDLNVAWTAERLFPWECFALRFTMDDLQTVIKFIQTKDRRHKPARSLSFRSFISGPYSLSFFEEDLCEARALARTHKPTPKDKILSATGRAAPEVDTCRTAAQIMAGEKAFEQFRNLKQNL